MNMRIDLTGLADLANAQLTNKGRPLALAVEDVLPDPDNPRDIDMDNTPAAIEAQEALDADVAARGVKTPISVRPHPTVPGKYIINYGHRRYKSTRKNNLATIPAFIDEKFDSYDQLNENELHLRLTTRARALFIKGRLDAGDSKGQIAERMHKKNQTFITEHLAVIDAPECVNDAYGVGVTSARTLYDLRQAWMEFPTEIDTWCRGAGHITRHSIRDALVRFRHDEADSTSTSDGAPVGLQRVEFRHDEKVTQADEVGLAVKAVAASQDESSKKRGSGKGGVTSDARPSGRPSQRVRLSTLPQASTTPLAPAGEALVYYEGKLARIASHVVVPIVLDGSGEVLTVPVSALVFK